MNTTLSVSPEITAVQAKPVALARLGMLAALLANWALLLAGLAQQSLWVDEWYTRYSLRQPWAGLLPSIEAIERRPPFYYALLKLWSEVAGGEELALRLWSVVMVVLAVALLYALGVRLFDRRTALVAAWLLALSPFWLLYGRMIRSYSLTMLLALLATLLLVLAVRQGRWWWAAYGLAAAALVYTDYSGLPVLAAHGVYVLALTRRRTLRLLAAWLVTMVAVGLVYLLWLPAILRATSRSVRITDLAGGPVGFSVKLAMPFFVWGAGETIYPWNPLGLVAALVAGLLLVWGLWRTLRTRAATGWLLLAWLALPLLFTATLLALIATDITFLNSASRTPGAYPAFALAMAAGLWALRRQWLRYVAAACIVGGLAAAIFNCFAGREYLNPIYAIPTRAIAADLAQQAGPDDLILAERDTLVGDYYQAQTQAQTGAEPGKATYQDVDPAQNLAWIEQHQPPRVWVVTFGRDSTEGAFGTPELLQQLQQGYAPGQATHYGPVEPSYRAIKQRLTGRPAYDYKLTVTRYEHKQ